MKTQNALVDLRDVDRIGFKDLTEVDISVSWRQTTSHFPQIKYGGGPI